MLKMFKPEDTIDQDAKKEIFLAGSIEMGNADKWQEMIFKKVCDKNKDYKGNVNFYNPYRDDWDSSWKQRISDKKFQEQVSWEWEHLLKSNLIIVYFQDETKSPISLLELGAMAAYGKKIIVCATPKFWRFGNIEFICDFYKKNITLVNSLDDLISKINDWL